MLRRLSAIVCLMCSLGLGGADEKKPDYPSFDYDAARAHELKPHRRTIPHVGVDEGFNQLKLTLTVSPTGDVVDGNASGEDKTLKLWPELQGEVWQWKFTPFEVKGKAVTAEVEEYIDLVPPERLPKKHVAAPVIRPDSKIEITLSRSGCFGSCPSYRVTVSTEGTVFDGGGFVVAEGRHTDVADASVVRNFAKKFVAADFYSMADSYRAGVTDNPTYGLSISIDGQKKVVSDYVGEWVGMPAVISELEEEVDEFARTKRWIEGSEGMVQALSAEGFNFHTYEAQVMLKTALRNGQTATLRELLAAGVPLTPLAVPKPKEAYLGIPYEHVGWLNAASGHADALLALIDAGASKEDQNDKDLALSGAAEAGNLEGARALIAYGANPNADLSKLVVTHDGGGMTMEGPGAGSVLISAAGSGNPEMVKEILRYHPKLEARDRDGKTAIFSAGDYRYNVEGSARAECVKLLAAAGADINAHDRDGNTPLHETFLTEVEEELLKLGADVNARNNDGETPIMTTVDKDAYALYIKHGADLTMRNNKGQTVVEAVEARYGKFVAGKLREAIAESKQ